MFSWRWTLAKDIYVVEPARIQTREHVELKKELGIQT